MWAAILSGEIILRKTHIINNIIPRHKKMNYLKIYCSLIRKAENRTLPKEYTEKHHIFPISIYGKNNKVVVLTGREHYIAHILLAKICIKRYGLYHKNTQKMLCAIINMKGKSKRYYNSYLYENAKIKRNESIRGENNWNYGKPRTQEVKDKISLGNKGRLSSDPKGEKLKKYRKLYGNFWTGKKHTEEYKKLKSIDRLNYYQTENGKKQKDQIAKTLKQKGIKPPKHALGLSKGTKWWNNGKVNRRSTEKPGEDFILGRIKGQWKWDKK